MPVGRSGLSPIMVGRAAELERLGRLFPLRGDPELALISGEAGVGKTRLVNELLARIPAGTPILAGRAQEGGMGRPFELLLEAIEPLVAGWIGVPAALEGRAEQVQLLLAPVVPAFAGHPDRGYGPEELLRAGTDLFRHLVGGQPTALIFEDLHWADAESVTLFGRLATSSDLPVLLVGTYRPEDLGRRDPLAQVLVSLDRQRTMVQVTVDRLDRPGVRDLLSAVFECPIPWPVVDAMYERTGGNPFFLEELLVTACCADPEALTTLPLPWNLTEAVLRHLDGLAPEALRIVDAAAVLGQRISFDLLAAVTGTGEDELIAALRTLVAGNLLVEEEPDVFSFRHALTREAVESQLLGRERRRLHEKALAALLETGTTDYAGLAHHAHAAARFDEALDYARRGALHFLRTGSSWQALRLLELALSEAPDDLELLGQARLAAWMIGLNDVALGHAERALDLATRQGRPEVEAKMLAHMARIQWDLGDIQGHWRTVERALALTESLPPSQELAATQALVAEAYMLLGRADEAISWADRSLDLAAQLDRPFLRPRALVAKGTAMLHKRDLVPEGLAVLDEAQREAEVHDNGAALVRALYNSLDHRSEVMPTAEVWPLVWRIREVAERAGFDKMAGTASAILAVQVAVAEGDRATAEQYLAEAQRRNHSPDSGPETMLAARFECILALEAGDLGVAAGVLVRCVPPPGSEPIARVDHHQLVIGVAAQRGNAAAVRAQLDAFAAEDDDRQFWGEATADIVASALRAGVSPAEVRTAVAAVLAQPESEVARPADLRHIEAQLLEAEGDTEGALDLYLAAVRPAMGFDPVWNRAGVYMGAARCLLARDRIDESRPLAELAVDLLERWPGWRQREAAALMRRLDPRPAPGSDGDPTALTPREREVAALLAEGLSNAELARRLYISTKTAAVHVSNILAKLGMSSRAEVAAWAVRTGVASA